MDEKERGCEIIMKTQIELYEYGNGIYADFFWDRVVAKLEEYNKDYVIKKISGTFTPAFDYPPAKDGHVISRGDELKCTLYVEPRKK